MNDIYIFREKYYKLVRILAVFIIGPLLIYKGKKLEDNTKTLCDIGFKDGEFMVVTMKKVDYYYYTRNFS